MASKRGSKKQIVTKKVSKALKISPVRNAPLEFSGDRRIKESVVITISSAGGFSRQLTVHRPIGVTDLGDEDWVVSHTSDIAQLLATAKDPSADKLYEDRRVFKLESIIAKDPTIIELDEQGQLHYKRDEATRKKRIDDARKAEREANKSKAGWKPTAGSFISFMDDKLGQKEIKLRQLLASKKLNEQAAIKHPQSYRTNYARGYSNNQKNSGALINCGRPADVFNRIVSLLENYDETSKALRKARLGK